MDDNLRWKLEFVDAVDFYGGATVVKTYGNKVPFVSKTNAVTLGSFIIGNNKIEADPNNPFLSTSMDIICKVKIWTFIYE